VVIPFEPLWAQYKRIIKPGGAIVLTASQPFTSALVMSNIKMFKYSLVWDKQLISGFLNANRMPLRVHEDILIFYSRQPTYNPQKFKGEKSHSKGRMLSDVNHDYGDYKKVDNTDALGEMKHPRSIVSFQKPHPSKALHPTQKPVALFEYLIKTYTNEGDLVLDNCAGSGTTGVACINTNRRYILIEKEHEYVEVARQRLLQTKPENLPTSAQGTAMALSGGGA
jgi:site-specific DNA-methyltransferase (adenine-specific)